MTQNAETCFESREWDVTVLGRTDRHNSSREVVTVIPGPSVSGYAVNEDLSPYLRNWQSPRGSQLPVCPSTAHNRDLGRTGLLRLALNPSKWFRKQWAAALFESRTARRGRRYDYHRMLSHFLPTIPNRDLVPLKKARSKD